VTPRIRSCAAACILLYAMVGFLAGACPSSDEATHHHQHKSATHAFACAWACHASVGQHAVDAPSPTIAFWLISIMVGLGWAGIAPPRLIAISARPPPFITI
jgi:hypothetical protein